MCIWIVGGSSNRNASRDESVQTGDESVETGDESVEVETEKKHNNHVIICNITYNRTLLSGYISHMGLYVITFSCSGLNAGSPNVC